MQREFMRLILTVRSQRGNLEKAMEFARQGRYKIIYAAPERLMTESFWLWHRRFPLMVAVDEAHCISQWDRISVQADSKIVDFIQQLPMRPVLACNI